jgi:hypothetical protein
MRCSIKRAGQKTKIGREHALGTTLGDNNGKARAVRYLTLGSRYFDFWLELTRVKSTATRRCYCFSSKKGWVAMSAFRASFASTVHSGAKFPLVNNRRFYLSKFMEALFYGGGVGKLCGQPYVRSCVTGFGLKQRVVKAG